MAQIVFHSKENRTGPLRKGRDRLRYTVASVRSGYGKSSEVNAASMLLKLGLCAAACALVFVLNTDNQDTEKRSELSGSETEDAEKPGTLKFVEFPGILSVFSEDKAYSYPISSCSASFTQEYRLLCLHSTEKQNVCAIEDGIVVDSGDNDDGGNYIALKTEGDLVWFYSGMKSLRAETGQSLKANDTIGEAEKDSTLYLRCERNGKPVDLQKMFAADGGI